VARPRQLSTIRTATASPCHEPVIAPWRLWVRPPAADAESEQLRGGILSRLRLSHTLQRGATTVVAARGNWDG